MVMSLGAGRCDVYEGYGMVWYGMVWGGVEFIPFCWPAVLALRKCEAFLLPWALVLGLVVSVCESRARNGMPMPMPMKQALASSSNVGIYN
ncbi:hypothetical protein DFP73DRAFT_180216 [Morchella snyderi]|nr:hypothetical protein DFP73DRAFT_180216 [Morchella snyderi]